jgi:hypothetical protein
MNLVRDFHRLVRRRRSHDDEIERCKRALVRHHAVVDEMASEWSRVNGVCCPGCMFGATYSEAADQCERTGKWLCVLLRRRGRLADLKLVRAIEVSAWP